MDSFVRDVRFGARMLLRNAGSTTISVIALALGIGLTTMAFSIVWGGVLRGLPFDNADRLVSILRTNLSEGEDQMGVSIHDYEDWREQQTSFADLAAFYTGTINVSGTDSPDRFDGGFVTVNTFGLVGVEPMLGRGFTADDGRVGADGVMLLSYDTWRNQFGSDPGVVGRTLRVNARTTTIIGVMPEGFGFPNSEQVWVPLPVHASALPRGGGSIGLTVFGPLRDGVSLDRASAEMASIASRLETAYPETNEGIGTVVMPYVRGFIGNDAIVMLYTMLGAVFMVLLIACANVANLLIARASARSREVGIRTAMGASGVRIVRQFLTESVLLSLAGAVLGIAIALMGNRLFNQGIAPTDPPFWIDVRLDGSVLMFVVAITALSGLISGAIPAWQASRSNVADVLKDESRGGSSFRLGRISRALVVTEIALSAGLLVGAGLMVKSVTKVKTIDFAFDTDIFTARVGLPEAQYGDAESQRRFFEQLLPRLRSVPGLAGVGLLQALPATGSIETRFAVEGAAYPNDRDYPQTNYVLMSPGALDALGVPIVQGRDFTDRDRDGSQPVAIVNEELVRRFFGGQDPIGRRVRIGTSESEEQWLTIIGVVPDMYAGGLETGEDQQTIYAPLSQNSARFMSVIARVNGGDPMALTQGVRDAVLGVDADLPIYFVQTLRKAINDNNWFYMVFGSIFTVFGAAALFLAAVGLYGVMSTSVRQRTREMGVRMALGAQRGDVRGLIMRQGLFQLAIGLAFGLGLALLVSNLLQLLLFEVNPRDPAIFVTIGAVLTATTVTATLFPALRATRVDPIRALRYD